jgi:SAM-dependent methyltransferase
VDKDFYFQYAAVEDQHWWFVGRRRIIDRVIRQLKLSNDPQILEAGCGTGGNLKMLSRHGQVSAMELETTACEFANQRQVTLVKQGSLPDQIPFATEYDLILILDVIEHLDDDLAALKALKSRLKPGGWLLVTVPAYQFLWSQHDEINHHKRRYTVKQLRQVVRQSGYGIKYSTYFNSFLFPAVAAVRLLQKLFKIETKASISIDLNLPAKPINQLLATLFASERHFMGRIRLPFGVSALLVAQTSPVPASGCESLQEAQTSRESLQEAQKNRE